MGAYKENEGLIKENFILKFFLGIVIIGLVITFTAAIKFSNEYNDLYKEAITKINNDDLQIKLLMKENRELEIEYNDLCRDNEANIKYIDWLNSQIEGLSK